jgi:hypothetical protein
VQPQFMVGLTKTKPSFNLTKYIFMWLTLNLTRSHITKHPLNKVTLDLHLGALSSRGQSL